LYELEVVQVLHNRILAIQVEDVEEPIHLEVQEQVHMLQLLAEQQLQIRVQEAEDVVVEIV
jgi:hypothetical protein